MTSSSKALSNPAPCTINLSEIEPLDTDNFKKWYSDLEIALGLGAIDMPLRNDRPSITVASTTEHKALAEEWDRQNKLVMLIMLRTMTDHMRGSIAPSEKAKEFLENIKQMFEDSDEEETRACLETLLGMKYDGLNGVRAHILKMVEIEIKLRQLNFVFNDNFIGHLALNSLPSSFGQLKTIYNTLKDKWTIQELITICVHEETRIKNEKGKEAASINFVSKQSPKPQNSKGKKGAQGNGSNLGKSSNNHHHNNETPPYLKPNKSITFKCFFCDKVGHRKKDCFGFKNWMTNKGFSKEKDSK